MTILIPAEPAGTQNSPFWSAVATKPQFADSIHIGESGVPWPESLVTLRDTLAVTSPGRRDGAAGKGSQPTGWVVPVLMRFLAPWHYLHIGGDVLPCVRQHGVTEGPSQHCWSGISGASWRRCRGRRFAAGRSLRVRVVPGGDDREPDGE